MGNEAEGERKYSCILAPKSDGFSVMDFRAGIGHSYDVREVTDTEGSPLYCVIENINVVAARNRRNRAMFRAQELARADAVRISKANQSQCYLDKTWSREGVLVDTASA